MKSTYLRHRDRTRVLIGLTVLVSLGALVAATAGNSAGKGPIVIGGIGPLSLPGDIASGKEMKWAEQQAVADINAKGGVLGRKLKLVFDDTQGRPEVAAQVAKRLVERDKVAAVVGEVSSSEALGASPTYRQAGVPVIFVDTWSDSITGGDPTDLKTYPKAPKTIFRIAPTVTFVNNVQINWIKQGLKAKKVIHIYEATSYGEASAASFKKLVTDAGLQWVGVKVNLNETDYTPIVSRLAQTDGDAGVVFIDVTGDSGFVVEENAINAGLIKAGTVCFANSNAGQDTAFWKAVPDGAGCAFPLIGPLPSQKSKTADALRASYKKTFNTDPHHVILYSWDAIHIMADAIRRAGSTSSQAIVRSLEKTSYVGLAQKYTFPYTSSHKVPAGVPSAYWHSVANPGFHMVEYTAPQQPASQVAVLWPPVAQTTPGSAYIKVSK